METIAYLQQFASPALDHSARFVTALGSTRAYIILLLSAYLVLDARLGQRLGIFVLFGFYFNFQLKGLVGTTRPFVIDPEVARTPEAALSSGPGFPSAHAQLSLTFWGYLAWWLQRRWVWLLAALVVLLISLSRLYLGVHFPIDVLGGLGIGLLYTAVVAAAEPLWARLWASLKQLSSGLRVLLGVLIPLGLLLVLPPPGQEAELILGALAAFLSAPQLLPYTPPRKLWQRLVVALVGIVLVFAALSGSSLLLPEGFKREPLGGFVRYLVIAYVGLLLTPWLAQRARLAPVKNHATD